MDDHGLIQSDMPSPLFILLDVLLFAVSLFSLFCLYSHGCSVSTVSLLFILMVTVSLLSLSCLFPWL